ncbi:sugar phosphate isomerase/epimerase family protein [Rubritalea marina]|uniref:sugar phosphate isomerase/epimerase family protein n=1 Tax=Rubritalea marina TaxID=361055 RepID=UPI00037BB870|nr:TIM barrel protein [Rubritalea marina]
MIIKTLRQLTLGILTIIGPWCFGQSTLAFYAFANGMQGVPIEKQAPLLKSLGYDGVSQVFVGGDALTPWIETYQAQGLKVLSIYINADEAPVSAEFMSPLAQGGIIELTVPKLNPAVIQSIRKTAQTASEHEIKVALYPHVGLAVQTIDEALKLINDVQHPNLGLMFNLCHYLKSEDLEKLEETLDRCAPHLMAVSTNGADSSGSDWDSLIQPLNRGSFPQQRLFDKLRAIGFTGPVGLQCYGIKEPPHKHLKGSMLAWLQLQPQSTQGEPARILKGEHKATQAPKN